MKNDNKFLSLYREYESFIRDQGIDPKDYEEKVDDETANRLRMCRQMRNYLSHQNDPGFLNISDNQIAFLESYTDSLKMQGDVVKKHLKAIVPATCGESDKCCDVLKQMTKLKTNNILVLSKKGVGVANIYDVINKALESKTTKMSLVKTKPTYKIVSPTTKMEDIPFGSVILCTHDGTETGKLLGVIYP